MRASARGGALGAPQQPHREHHEDHADEQPSHGKII
jgi:hypothetical protein